jgi:hypothetical protein
LVHGTDYRIAMNRMAFWNPVGGLKISNHVMRKFVTIGYKDLPNVIQYQVTFYAPTDHRHKFVQYEVLTAYMPAEFKNFYTLDPRGPLDTPKYLSDGPGEQNLPIIFCVDLATHCMGIYNPNSPQVDYRAVGYGRWRYSPRDAVVKWNNVFRFNEANIERTFTAYAIVGTLRSVVGQMRALHTRLTPANPH